MRQSFDQNVPLAEQIKRIIKSATGRKHQHRIGPGRKRQKQPNPKLLAKKRKLKKRVRAYWKGETNEHP
jgi:hypothetical protein